MATYAQLKKQIEQLAKQAEAALRAEKDVVLSKVRDAVSSFSLSVEEVFGVTTKKKTKGAKSATAKRVPRGAGQAKYADPKTGATWSGFGRAPAWLASAKDRTKFLIDQKPVTTAPAPSKAVKPSTKPKAAPKAVPKTTKAPATKKAAKAPTAAAPAKKAASAVVANAPAKKVAKAAPKAKAAAAKKTASTTSASAKKAAAPGKAKASVAPTPAAAQATAPAGTAAV